MVYRKYCAVAGGVIGRIINYFLNIGKVECNFTLKPGAQMPVKADPGSAGYDVRAYTDDAVIIKPGERRLVKTGILGSVNNSNYYIRIAPRSGLAYKNGIHVMAGVVDSSYRDEIGVILYNSGSEDFVVNNGDRIAQFIIEKCEDVIFNIVDTQNKSDRIGGFGSTGVK